MNEKSKKTIWTHEALNRGKVKHWIDEKGEIHYDKSIRIRFKKECPE